jgi:catechol 2,3-dioxygenase-like lactoylglutathione lyase family enzyme
MIPSERTTVFKDTSTFSGFSVDDVAAAKRFYGETLGLEVTEEGPGIVLHLAGRTNVLAYGKGDHQPATFTILNFEVDDVDEAVDALTEAGVAMEHYDGATDEKGIMRNQGPVIAWFKDPAGNVLSVIETS